MSVLHVCLRCSGFDQPPTTHFRRHPPAAIPFATKTSLHHRSSITRDTAVSSSSPSSLPIPSASTSARMPSDQYPRPMVQHPPRAESINHPQHQAMQSNSKSIDGSRERSDSGRERSSSGRERSGSGRERMHPLAASATLLADMSPLALLRRQLAHSSKYVRIALYLILLQTLVFVILESVILQAHKAQVAILAEHKTEIAIALFVNQSQLQADSVIRRAKALTFYYALFIVSLIFQFMLYLDAIRSRNTIQIFGLMMFHLMTLGYCVMQILQARNIIATPKIATDLSDMVPEFHVDRTLPVGIAILVIMTAFVMAWVYVNYKLYQEFGWEIFKRIGADLRMRRMYMIYQIFITILKFGVFMMLAFSASWLLMLLDEAEQQPVERRDFRDVWIHSVVSCGGSLLMVVLAYWAVRTENKLGMYMFLAADLATVGYLLSKIVLMSTLFTRPGVQCIPNWPPETCDRYDGSRNFFTLFISVDIIIGLVIAAIAIKALLNFDKGLLPHVDIKRSPSKARRLAGGWLHQPDGAGDGETSMQSLETSQTKRWTID